MKWQWLAVLVLISSGVHAELKGRPYLYKEGKTDLEGYLIQDDKLSAKRPAVIVVHDWMGVSDFTKERAMALAKMGYVAFVADIYGKGVRPKDQGEASKMAGKIKEDRLLMRARINAALAEVWKLPAVDSNRVAAIGYCFGGTTVLELARAGAPVAGVVSFHGGLDSPLAKDTSNVSAKVLVLHGADDPYVPPAQVADFEKEMNTGKADWQLVTYSGAVHSFSVPSAGHDNSKGAAYNASADRRSWQSMKNFLVEVFQPAKVN